MATFEELWEKGISEISAAKQKESPGFPKRHLRRLAEVGLKSATDIIRVYQEKAVDPASAVPKHIKDLASYGISEETAAALVEEIIKEVRG